MDCSLPGSCVHGILQSRILECSCSFSGGSSQPRGRTQVSHLAGWFFAIGPPGKPKQLLWTIILEHICWQWILSFLSFVNALILFCSHFWRIFLLNTEFGLSLLFFQPLKKCVASVVFYEKSAVHLKCFCMSNASVFSGYFQGFLFACF